MRRAEKIIKRGIVGLLVIALMAAFTACSNSPMAPGVEEQFAQQNMNLVSFGDDEAFSLGKVIGASALITPEEGGELVIMKGKGWLEDKFEKLADVLTSVVPLEINVLGLNKKSRLYVKLEVPPRAVDRDTTIYGEVDNKSIDMEFGPHGLIFNRPAKLTIIATKLKLKNINTETLNVYYDNPESGQWEIMEGAVIQTDRKRGTLIIRGTEIPHFSRYAVAWAK